MEILCPSCNKANTTELCQRCGCDLSQLMACAESARLALETAVRALSEDSAQTANEAAVKSWDLRHTKEAARLAFISSLAMGDPDTAVEWLRRSGFSTSRSVP